MVTMAWFSRPVAHHCAPPSKAAPPGFEPSTCGPEPRMLPITPESIEHARQESNPLSLALETKTMPPPRTHGSSGIRTQVFRL